MAPARTFGYLLPITPTIIALQDVMLRGVAPAVWLWLLLGGLVIVTFGLTNLLAA